jgi:hypothetical protein
MSRARLYGFSEVIPATRLLRVLSRSVRAWSGWARATGPAWRATRPPARGQTHCFGRLPLATAKQAAPPSRRRSRRRVLPCEHDSRLIALLRNSSEQRAGGLRWSKNDAPASWTAAVRCRFDRKRRFAVRPTRSPTRLTKSASGLAQSTTFGCSSHLSCCRPRFETEIQF